MSSMLPAEIKFSSPGNYRVRIVGDAFQKLWDYIEGEVEHVSTNKNGQVISTLKFHVRDQVELSGFIEVLFRRGFTLLSVERDDQI